ncbi:hypothetical protein C0Q44_23235 [Paenibacillus sp. PCH8]|uniref:hypothetical protein n=1 Tax=Paenibacillus sp. PCH8 TaxID=2066524 RepID=UPI000CF8AE4D|nr:hypothetical protein [Paenibacillus sp. PCH8]PQP81319.1 hypothetical protein C0Q44_23235 [Paenibacillus sp. PCH8]
MNEVNSWIKHIASNYILIIAAAVIFFAIKAVIGFYTYKHYDKKLEHLNHKVEFLISEQQRIAHQGSVPKETVHVMHSSEDHSVTSTQTHLT